MTKDVVNNNKKERDKNEKTFYHTHTTLFSGIDSSV
jgi:hypothetical protein